jgi:uncharacterized membrane protein YvbJ
MNFCSGCGVSLSNNPKFCPQCGQSISGPEIQVNQGEANQVRQQNKPSLIDLHLWGKTEGQSQDQIILWWVLRIIAAVAFFAFIATRN